jgi:hypothetical protein
VHCDTLEGMRVKGTAVERMAARMAACLALADDSSRRVVNPPHAGLCRAILRAVDHENLGELVRVHRFLAKLYTLARARWHAQQTGSDARLYTPGPSGTQRLCWLVDFRIGAGVAALFRRTRLAAVGHAPPGFSSRT